MAVDKELPLSGSFDATGQSDTFTFEGEAEIWLYGGTGTVRLEATPDAGSTWVPVSRDGSGTFFLTDSDGINDIIYTRSRELPYRLNCTEIGDGEEISYLVRQ